MEEYCYDNPFVTMVEEYCHVNPSLTSVRILSW